MARCAGGHLCRCRSVPPPLATVSRFRPRHAMLGLLRKSPGLQTSTRHQHARGQAVHIHRFFGAQERGVGRLKQEPNTLSTNELVPTPSSISAGDRVSRTIGTARVTNLLSPALPRSRDVQRSTASQAMEPAPTTEGRARCSGTSGGATRLATLDRGRSPKMASPHAWPGPASQSPDADEHRCHRNHVTQRSRTTQGQKRAGPPRPSPLRTLLLGAVRCVRAHVYLCVCATVSVCLSV